MALLVRAFLWTVLCVSTATALPGLPTVVALKGDGLILSKESTGGLPSMLFEGEKFFYTKAKIGSKIEKNSMIICNSDCRIKLVYPSGSSLFIAPGTTLRLIDAEETPEGERSVLQLIYGRLRSIVSKSHTAGWQIRTKSAISGVRGTDFLTRHAPIEGTEVTVLGGKVDVQPVDQPKTTAIELASHQSTHQETAGNFVKEQASKAQVLTAYEATLVPAAPVAERVPVQPLEEKAKTVALEELRISQPEVYKAIQDPTKIAPEELNRKLVEKPLQTAKSRGAAEPFTQDLDNYKKFMGDEK